MQIHVMRLLLRALRLDAMFLPNSGTRLARHDSPAKLEGQHEAINPGLDMASAPDLPIAADWANDVTSGHLTDRSMTQRRR